MVRRIITALQPIDLFDPKLERQHRHTEPCWMNYFNKQQPQHKHPQWNKKFWYWEENTDTLKLWELNHSRLPPEWRWHIERFTYSHNSDGFRNNVELDSVDWSQATVLFGSSLASCDGVPQSESIAHYTEEITGEPCICLGVSGGSCEVVYNNMIKMLHTYGKPKAIHVMWPDPVRAIDELELLIEDSDATWLRKDRGPWDIEPHHISSGNCFYRRNLIMWSVKHLFRGVQYSEIFDNRYKVVPGKLGHHMNKENILQITTPFPADVTEEMSSGTAFNTWSGATKLWYMNNYCARDIYAKWDGVGDPEYGTHSGRFVNKALARHFVDTQQVL